MTEHERIWLEPAPGADEDYGRQWCQHNVWADGVEYVRADTIPAAPIELSRVAEELAEESGAWVSCSGCHELNEGHPTGEWSNVLKCHLGLGCRECGGIGAVWDNTDYSFVNESADEASIKAERDRLREAQTWRPISTADKDAIRLTLGIVRKGVLEEIHIGGYRYAINDDEESCWWSDQCDDEIVPTHWMAAPPPVGGSKP